MLGKSVPEERFWVVVNDEEQYSIWPHGYSLPAGWYAAGTAGTKEECLAHIEQVWVDMRPRSLRAHLDSELGGAPGCADRSGLSATA